MTANIPEVRSSFPFRFVLVMGFLVAGWNFVLMFRGWVVASQAEVAGATILFVFLGVVPWIGLVATARARSVGPWILTISPLVALVGLLFTNNAEWETLLLVTLITAVPAITIGLVLLWLSRSNPVKANE